MRARAPGLAGQPLRTSDSGVLASADEDWDTTFSILARDPATAALGGAVATRRPAVGARIPFVRPGVGAVASQARSNPWLGVIVLDLLGHGVPVQAALASALAADPRPEDRQVHVVSAGGGIAAHTGSDTPDWHGHTAAADVSIAANHVVGPRVLEAMLRAYATSRGDLAERLMAALEAGDAAGGDARGKQSAALRIFRAEPFPWIELRVDDHPEPVQELRRLLTLFRDERARLDARHLSAYLKHP